MSDPRIHPNALCASDHVGPDSSVGAGTVVAPDVTIGSRCSIGDNVTVHGPTVISDAVDVETGARVLSNTKISDRVRIGANAVVGTRGSGNVDPGETVINTGVTIGAGAVIDAGLKIGSEAVVRPGAVVSSNVPAHAIVAGNPAQIQGYANAPTTRPLAGLGHENSERVTALGIGGCELWELPNYRDLRGSLVPLEHATDLPFVPARTFFVFDVPGEEVRGEHAHRLCAQFLVAVHGSMSVVVDDGVEATEVQLDRPSVGLLLPPGVWGVQYRFRADGVLAVFASRPYEADDYIRDYDAFLEFSRTTQRIDS